MPVLPFCTEQHFTGDDLHSFDNSDQSDDFLVPGSHVTKGQFLAMSMAFALKHHLTGVAFQDFLTLLNTITDIAYRLCMMRTEGWKNQEQSRLQRL